MQHPGAGLDGDGFHRQLRQRAVADRGEIVFAGIGLQQRDQFGDRIDLEFVAHRQRARLRDQLRDRGDVLFRIVGQLREQQRVNGQRAADADADRGAVGRGLGDGIGADIAAGAGLVLDDERAVGIFFAQLVGDQPGDDIGRRSRTEGGDDMHGFWRPVLRGGGQGKHRQQNDEREPLEHFCLRHRVPGSITRFGPPLALIAVIASTAPPMATSTYRPRA